MFQVADPIKEEWFYIEKLNYLRDMSKYLKTLPKEAIEKLVSGKMPEV